MAALPMIKNVGMMSEILMNLLVSHMIELSQPKFVEIVGDTEAFRLMLEGTLGEWSGAYDVLLADTNEYLYNANANLTQTSVPIFCKGELVATIYFGQSLAGDAEQLEAIGARVRRLAEWVSRIGAERLAYRDKQRVEHHQLQASEIVRETSQLLNDASIDWDTFWVRSATQLERMRDLIGAMCGMLLVPGRGRNRDRHIIVSVAGLPADVFVGADFELDADTVIEMEGTRGAVVEVNREKPAPVHRSIQRWNSTFADRIDKVFKVKLDFGEQHGVLAYFLNDADDIANSGLKIDNANRIEITMLEHFAAAIAHSFNNRRLEDKRRASLQTQKIWLEKVSHQLTQAFGAVRGHASNIQEFVYELQQFYPESFSKWTPADQKWFTDRVDDVMYSANNGARLAANLLRSAISPKAQNNIEWEWALIGDVAALMIEIARDFQGPAQLRKIGRVYVDTDSFKALNGRIRIITTDGLFKQAIGNLIDNAVKYAFPRTEIRITGAISAEMAVIEVHNDGIELLSSDVERVFEYGYRSSAANYMHAPGTGIGLYVAREIIEFHDGTLTANPSRRGRVVNNVNHYHTTFTAMIPLLPADSASSS
jgi:signal transduction histidine kinase